MPKPKRSSYESTLDVTLAHVGSVALSDKARVEVSIRRYDDGPPRVCSVTRGEKWTRGSVPRLTFEQASELGAVLSRARQVHDEFVRRGFAANQDPVAP